MLKTSVALVVGVLLQAAVAEYLEERDVDQTGWHDVVWFKDCVPLDKRMESANVFQTFNFRMQITVCLRGCEKPVGGCEHLTYQCGDVDGCVPKKGMSCDCLDCIMWCFANGNYGPSCMNDYQIGLCEDAKELNQCDTDCNGAMGTNPSSKTMWMISLLAGFLVLNQVF